MENIYKRVIKENYTSYYIVNNHKFTTSDDDSRFGLHAYIYDKSVVSHVFIESYTTSAWQIRIIDILSQNLQALPLAQLSIVLIPYAFLHQMNHRAPNGKSFAQSSYQRITELQDILNCTDLQRNPSKRKS